MFPTRTNIWSNKQNYNRHIGRCTSLNHLPYTILLKIVSFLPTKDAVRTSILSKRWQFIWTSIPKLCFVQGDTEDIKKFMTFINRALSLRGTSNITEFELKGKMESSLDVQSLITSVAMCDVEEFKLHLDHIKEALSIPLSLFTCSALTDLHIRMRGQKLILPVLIALPNLKFLSLWGVTFSSQHSAQNLFSGCPVLEHLHMVECNWLNVKAVKVLSSKLQKVNIREAYYGAQNDRRNRIEFVIQGNGLTHFTHCGFLYVDYCFLNPVLSLEEVNINMSSTHQNSEGLLRLLRCISHAPNLKFGLYTVSTLLSIPDTLNVPMFMGVRVLELDKKSSDFSDAGLLKVLENTPCIESLIFPEVLYLGTEGVLNNAMVLRKMEIQIGLLATSETRKMYPYELLKLPRASEDCGIYMVKASIA